MSVRSDFPPILLLSFLLLFFPLLAEGADSSTGVKLLKSDTSGAILELKVSNWKSEIREIDGKRFDVISYLRSGNSSEIGNPMLPVSRAYIGIPMDANPSLQIISSITHSTLLGKRLPPTPSHLLQKDSEGIELLLPQYVESGDAYRRGGFYPRNLADIVEDGYIRNQRVVLVELRSAQYDPSSRRVKLYSNLRVQVNFQNQVPSSYSNYATNGTSDSEAYERFFENNILNYQTARSWRKASLAPKLAPSFSHETKYKILVEQTGIYRITHGDLKEKWGIDLSGADPQNFKLENRGNDVPIYVSGEQDGRFDPQDYIEFYGVFPDNPDKIYTRWNVYWLSFGSGKGLRMVSQNGALTDPSPQFVSSFKSKIHFEEDHKHHKLQRVHPEQASPKDPYGWFEARDHWFWDGVSNSSDLNELNLNFTIYDPAQSELRPQIKVMLQGGTPVIHNALVSVNGYKVGNPKWAEQDEILIQKLLPAGSLTDGENKLTASRIDTDTDDETQNYPYHFYVNWFEVEYIRTLKAVNDRLDFTSFELDDASFRKKAKTFEFIVHGFLSDEVEVFEMDKNFALAKVSNLKVEKVGLSFEQKERIRRIVESVDKSVPISNFAYNVSFQYPSNRKASFIAVSNRSLLKPFKVVKSEGPALKEPKNSADYIIVYHPIHQQAAQNLAEWRSDPKGGGFRVKLADVTKVYDEFNFGMVNPKAIKDFLRYAFENWVKPAPSYVVILGDGTYDLLGIDKKLYPLPPELAGYIPTFFIWTQFGQTSIDHWYVTVSGNDAIADMFLGRIPVETVDESNAAVQKIVNYEKSPPNGEWRRTVLAVADDGSTVAGDDLFRSSLIDIATNYTLLGYKTKGVYLEDFQVAYEDDKNVFKGKKPREVVYDMIIDSLSEGAILSQYAGHGGRTVWAHEIIFDIPGIQELRETDKLSFMLVLSCYNGFFDEPGQPSMAEMMIRQNRRGIIGMLSATRLTYGTGNYALNTIIFDELFRRNIRRLGDITFNSKVIMLATEGISWLDSMEQYTLFGDPALPLAMADYEVQPALENSSVGSNRELKVTAGQILKPKFNPKTGQKEYSPISNFNGKLTATVGYPSGKSDSKIVEVVAGRFGEIRFSVPADAGNGNGLIEVYAEDKNTIAIGGATFSVNLPKILEIQAETVDEKSLLLYAKLTDDTGLAGIKSAFVKWFEPSTANWLEATLNPDRSKGLGWYKIATPIPIPQNSKRLTYQISVSDVDGNETKSPIQDYQIQSDPNLQISDPNFDPNAIAYIYSEEHKSWGLNVKVVNKGDSKVDRPLKVYLFEGNPDKDRDKVVDADAKIVGSADIDPKDWTISATPDLLYSTPAAKKATIFDGGDVAIKFIKTNLKRGKQLIFAWVDPEFDTAHPAGQYGTILEEREDDNISMLNLDVANYLIGQDRNMTSSDDVLSINFPSVSTGDFIPISVKGVNELPKTPNQPGLLETALSNSSALGYKIETYPNLSNLKEPYLININIDLDHLRREVAKSLNLTVDLRVENPQKNLLEEKLKDELKNASAYVWQDAVKRWSKLKSAALLDSNGNLAKRVVPSAITTENSSVSPLKSSDIRLDHQLNFSGEWVIMFVSTFDYRIFFRPEGGELKEISRSDEEAPRLSINLSSKFEFGEIFKLKVVSNAIDPLFQVVFDGNDGDGVIKDLRVEGTKGTADRWVAMFVDPERFILTGERSGTVKGATGNPLLGKVGEEFQDPNSGLTFAILPGDRKFGVGDNFKFETKEASTIQATTSQLGLITVMRSADSIPPHIQLSVGSQNFLDGDPVSSKPNLQALVFDANGVDTVTRKIEIQLSRNSGPFLEAKESHIRIRSDVNSNNVIINYRPELEAGRYELQLIVSDFNGNESREKIRFEVKDNLQLLNVMNYPNPFKRETKITCEVTAEMDEMLIKIYSVSGRLIRTLEKPETTTGFMNIEWDGKDGEGDEVANGPYYCKVSVKKSGSKDLVKYIKMMKLK